jgi:hypothetical protein
VRCCVPEFLVVIDSNFTDLCVVPTRPAYSDCQKRGGAFFLEADGTFTANFSGSCFLRCKAIDQGGAVFARNATLLYITDCHFKSCECATSGSYGLGSACVVEWLRRVIVQYTFFVENIDKGAFGSTFDCMGCPCIKMTGISFVNNLFPHAGDPGELQLEAVAEPSWFNLSSLCFMQAVPNATHRDIVCRAIDPDQTDSTVFYFADVFVDTDSLYALHTEKLFPVYVADFHTNQSNAGCAVRPTATLWPSTLWPSTRFSASRSFARSKSFLHTAACASNPPRATGAIPRSGTCRRTALLSPSAACSSAAVNQSALEFSGLLIPSAESCPSEAPFGDSNEANETGAAAQTLGLPASAGPPASAEQPTEEPRASRAGPGSPQFAGSGPGRAPTATSGPRTAAASGSPEPQAGQAAAAEPGAGMYVGIGVGAALLLVAAAIAVWCLRRRAPAFRKPDDDWSVAD